MAAGLGCFAGVPEVLEDLRKLYAEHAARRVAEERIDRGVAFRGDRVSTLESTVNLKPNELLAVIAAYARDIVTVVDSSLSRDALAREPRPGQLIKPLVERMQQIAAELE
jgi:hypothetical protein